jgi:hypothetical protein
MNSYFHFAPILLAPGSIIEPGNFGRIIRQQGEAHRLYRREMIYDEFRNKQFPDRPSRLQCVFCFPTLEEAELCRTHINGYAESILYEVQSDDPNPHLADMNNGVQHFETPIFDANVITYYWRGWTRSPDPRAAVLREVLLRHPVTVTRKV